MDEGSLGVHQIELVVESLPGGTDGGGVGETTNSSVDLCQVSAWYSGRWLVVDSNLRKQKRFKVLKQYHKAKTFLNPL